MKDRGKILFYFIKSCACQLYIKRIYDDDDEHSITQPQKPFTGEKILHLFFTEAELYIAHFVPKFVAMATTENPG